MSLFVQSSMGVFRELSDQDKDGRLSIDEYCIAMHLMTLVRTRGVSLPATLPAELHSPSMATKFHTIDRATAHKMTAADRMKVGKGWHGQVRESSVAPFGRMGGEASL